MIIVYVIIIKYVDNINVLFHHLDIKITSFKMNPREYKTRMTTSTSNEAHRFK